MQVLYHNDDIAVCLKPIGLDSEHGVPAELKKLIGGDFFTVHRLDLNVGGVMVYARNKHSAALLSKVIANNEMIKEYVAKVYGNIENDGFFEDLLFKDSRKNKVFVVKRQRKGVKSAKLEYIKLSSDSSTSTVRIKLHTGRSHQIRVQFASRGFTLVGDGKYGARDNVKFPMLYSCKITFPYKNEILSFESLPDWASER